MLHAERLTRVLADEAIAEILLEQAKAHPAAARAARALARARRAARPRPARRDHRGRVARPRRRSRRKRADAGEHAESGGVTAMSLRPSRSQGPVIARHGRRVGAGQRLAQRRAGDGRRPATLAVARAPSSPPRPDGAWSATTCAHVGGDPACYRGTRPGAPVPAVGLSAAGQADGGAPVPAAARRSTAAAAWTQHAPLPAGEPLQVARAARGRRRRRRSARPRSRSDRDRDARARPRRWSRICTCSSRCRSRSEGRREDRQGRRVVPVEAREIAFFKLGPRAGLDFAKLTGDFNPRALGAALRQGVRLPQPHPARLRHPGARDRGAEPRPLRRRRRRGSPSIDVRFTRPLVLPARVGVYVRGEQALGRRRARRAGAYLEGSFNPQEVSS